MNSSYRAALTFRYLDDLPVRRVAALIGRPEQATEALLVRARAAFRLDDDRLGEEAGDE